jgi:hypothetical protein
VTGPRRELVDQVATDEPCSPDHEYAHATNLPEIAGAP